MNAITQTYFLWAQRCFHARAVEPKSIPYSALPPIFSNSLFPPSLLLKFSKRKSKYLLSLVSFPVGNRASDDTNIVAIVVPIGVVAAVILAIIVLVPSVVFYRRWRKSRKWKKYIEVSTGRNI